MEAPASVAASDSAMISSGVTGKCGDIEGVWIAPVMAQVMMTLPACGFIVLMVGLSCFESQSFDIAVDGKGLP